jgi:hypothetical protein
MSDIMDRIRRMADLEATMRAALKRLRSAASVARENDRGWEAREMEAAADLLEDALGRTA